MKQRKYSGTTWSASATSLTSSRAHWSSPPVRALQLRLEYLRPSSVNFRVAFQFSASAWDTSVLGAYSADGWRVHVALCTVGPRM